MDQSHSVGGAIRPKADGTYRQKSTPCTHSVVPMEPEIVHFRFLPGMADSSFFVGPYE